MSNFFIRKCDTCGILEHIYDLQSFFLWLEMQQAPTAQVEAVLELHSEVDEGMCTSFTFIW